MRMSTALRAILPSSSLRGMYSWSEVFRGGACDILRVLNAETIETVIHGSRRNLVSFSGRKDLAIRALMFKRSCKDHQVICQKGKLASIGVDRRGSQVKIHSIRPEIGGENPLIWKRSSPNDPLGSRKLWTSVPLQMGRRSAKIATRKGAQDKKKSKLYGKVGKQIVKVVKEGGPNPTANSALAVLLLQAKESDVPKDIIDRNIKRATEKNQQEFLEMTYEVYGFGGVGLVLEVLTDNNNRAAATIRDVVKKNGAKIADPGSVLFNFQRAGVISVKASEVDLDDLLLQALDAGAEDVIQPSSYEDEDGDNEDDKFFRVITSTEQYPTVYASLKKAGIPADPNSSGLELVPLATVEADDEAVEMNQALIEKLLELDDVDAVYSTQQ